MLVYQYDNNYIKSKFKTRKSDTTLGTLPRNLHVPTHVSYV